MKQLLDRLMARQAKLMGRLQPEPKKRPAEDVRVAKVTPEERADRLRLEQEALDACVEPLSREAISEAATLLEPLAEGACDVRTLTTLARVRELQGDKDEALRLLQSAEKLDPSDEKAAAFMADLLQGLQRHHEAIFYRRRVAFSRAQTGANAYLQLIDAIVSANVTKKTAPLGEIRTALAQLEKAPDLDAQTRFATAQRLYRLRGVARTGLAWLHAALPCPAEQIEISPRCMTLGKWCSENPELGRVHAIADGGEPGRRPLVAELKNVVMHPRLGGAPLLAGGHALGLGFAGGLLRRRLDDESRAVLLDKGSGVVLRLPRDLRTIEEPALYIGGSDALERDLLECLGGLATVEALRLAPELPLVISTGLTPRHRELLELLGFGQRRLIEQRPDEPLRFEHLWLPGRLVEKPRWVDPLLPRWYVGKQGQTHGTQRLWLVNAQTRQTLSNFDDVDAKLQSLGWRALDTDALSVRDVAAAFASASDVVGLHGSALAYSVFAPAGVRLRLIHDPLVVGRLFYSVLAHACGHTVTPVRSRRVQVSLDADQSKLRFLVDVAELTG